MKRDFMLLCLVFMAFASSTSIRREAPETDFIVDFSEPELTTYEIAAALSGCPVEILYGIAFAESTYIQDAIGDDGISCGRFQINEKFHEYNAKTYGEYNPMCPLDTAILTGKIFMADLAALGNVEDAIAAHNQGRTGVRNKGRDREYVNRVLSHMERPV